MRRAWITDSWFESYAGRPLSVDPPDTGMRIGALYRPAAPSYDEAVGPPNPHTSRHRHLHGVWDDPTWVSVEVDVGFLERAPIREHLVSQAHGPGMRLGWVITWTLPGLTLFWDAATPDDGVWRERQSDALLFLRPEAAEAVARCYRGVLPNVRVVEERTDE